jgi:hypothetical protein
MSNHGQKQSKPDQGRPKKEEKKGYVPRRPADSGEYRPCHRGGLAERSAERRSPDLRTAPPSGSAVRRVVRLAQQGNLFNI